MKRAAAMIIKICERSVLGSDETPSRTSHRVSTGDLELDSKFGPSCYTPRSRGQWHDVQDVRRHQHLKERPIEAEICMSFSSCQIQSALKTVTSLHSTRTEGVMPLHFYVAWSIENMISVR